MFACGRREEREGWDGSGVVACRPPVSWLCPEPAQAGGDPESSSLDDSLIAQVEVDEGFHPELGARCHVTEGPRHSRHRLVP